jgi:hypothetical protein
MYVYFCVREMFLNNKNIYADVYFINGKKLKIKNIFEVKNHMLKYSKVKIKRRIME